MDKTSKRLIILFALIMIALPLYVGSTYLFNHFSKVSNNINNEDYQITQEKEKLSQNLKDKATIQSEEDDSSSVLVVYQDEQTLNVIDRLIDDNYEIRDSKQWQALVKDYLKYSKESPDLTISIVDSFDDSEGAYLVLYNGNVLFNITDDLA